MVSETMVKKKAFRVPRKIKAVFQFGVTIALFCLAGLFSFLYGSTFVQSDEAALGRNLQEANETCGTFSFSELVDITGGAEALCPGYEAYLILAMLLMLYMFWALAIVVDEYFIPALEYFQEYWVISPDVAGATLMAAGGSAPEFFTNLFSSINLTTTGFGTIVGSAVFNILFVIAAVAWFSREVLSLEWWIVFRDSSYYAFTIFSLAFFYQCGNNNEDYECKADGVMLPYESVILFVEYIVYCLVLFTCHESIRDFIEKRAPFLVPKAQRNPMLIKDGGGDLTPADLENDAAMDDAMNAKNESNDDLSDKRASLTRRGSINSVTLRDLRENDGETIPLRPETACPNGDEEVTALYKVGRFVAWAFSMPIVILLGYSVPRCDTDFWAHENRESIRIFIAIIGFILSLVWIGIFTWIMVFSAETFGKTIGIPDVVMGYTFLAAGTSAPDLLSSVFVALKGEGGQAVSSSIGSNIFDITVGLPIPWLISTAIGNEVVVQAASIFTSLAVLLGMLVSVVVVVIWQGWKLTNTLAVGMMILYFIFLIIVLVPEFA